MKDVGSSELVVQSRPHQSLAASPRGPPFVTSVPRFGLHTGVRVFCLGGPLSLGTQIDAALAAQPAAFDRKHRAKLTPQDTYGFIYTRYALLTRAGHGTTSGTQGAR